MKRKALRRGLPSTGGRAGALCVCCVNGRVPRLLFRRDLRPRLAARSIAALAVRKTQSAKSSRTAGVEFFLPALKGRAARGARLYTVGCGWQRGGARSIWWRRCGVPRCACRRSRLCGGAGADCFAARPARTGDVPLGRRGRILNRAFPRCFAACFASVGRRCVCRGRGAVLGTKNHSILKKCGG